MRVNLLSLKFTYWQKYPVPVSSQWLLVFFSSGKNRWDQSAFFVSFCFVCNSFFLPFSPGLTNYSRKVAISQWILTNSSCDNLDLLNWRWAWDLQDKCLAHAGKKIQAWNSFFCVCLSKPIYVHEFICMLDIVLEVAFCKHWPTKKVFEMIMKGLTLVENLNVFLNAQMTKIHCTGI